MFTGIIEEIGEVKSIFNNNIVIKAKKILNDINIGDSIAVNGVCLTVVNFSNDDFTADVMPETLRKTNLKNILKGTKVNLERAMPLNGRFGGHIVSGHIDGVGKIINFKNEDNAVWITIETEKNILKYIVQKGSIAIDGISLTVAYIDDKIFKVSIIPHTGEETILLNKKEGDIVNLENDIISKYVEKLLNFNSKDKQSNIDMDFLIKCGF